jgi:hypothetical protein
MTSEQDLWTTETGLWPDARPRLTERHLTRSPGLAVLSYRIAGAAPPVRCISTYARACGDWMLVEHRQSAG